MHRAICRTRTIGVVATNATLTKAQATKVAQMAHDGYARAIYPVHTPSDGDVVFTLATGKYAGEVNLTQIGALAADVMAEAIVRAVREATGIEGVPAVRDLASKTSMMDARGRSGADKSRAGPSRA